MPYIPIQLKQLDQNGLSGFILLVAAGSVNGGFATVNFTTGISGFLENQIVQCYLASNPQQFISSGNAGAQFYPLTGNPSGFDINGYISASGFLQTEINSLISFSGGAVTIFGNQNILGNKNFLNLSSFSTGSGSFNFISLSGVSGCSGLFASGWVLNQSGLMTVTGQKSIDVVNRFLFDQNGNVSYDYNNHILSGNTTVQALVSSLNYQNLATYNVIEATDYFLCANTSGAAQQYNFPSPTIYGKQYVIKDVAGQAGPHQITISGAAGVAFDNVTGFRITGNYGSVQLFAMSGKQYSVITHQNTTLTGVQ